MNKNNMKDTDNIGAYYERGSQRSRQDRDVAMLDAQKKTGQALGIFFTAILKGMAALALDSVIVMYIVNHFDPAKLNFFDALLIIIAIRTILPKSMSTLEKLTPQSNNKQN